MQSRRAFLATVSAAAAAAPASAVFAAGKEPAPATARPKTPRAFWSATLTRVVEPVLQNLAQNQLRRRMPVEALPGRQDDRAKVTHLEAFGRTLCGLAPWLDLASPPPDEAERIRRLAAFARQGLDHATDPAAADAMNFSEGGQPLVDAAFLSLGLLRAPSALWKPLDASVKQRVIQSLKATRAIKPPNCNWLLFSAMVETFLASIGEAWLPEPINTALVRHEEWYKGDGWYGDGPDFHFDYYNSYVIQPFMVEVLEAMDKVTPRWSGLREKVLKRARRHALIQERLIAPDGSFAVFGRSIAYRCGAFHLLAQAAWRNDLPEALPPGQVRSALGAVIERTLGAPNTFDSEGWLRLGLRGHQPSLAEPYISTGSLYLCTFAFLPLGLPAESPFWKTPDTDWTARKLWSGQDVPADHALNG
jgi:hypothetical protein